MLPPSSLNVVVAGKAMALHLMLRCNPLFRLFAKNANNSQARLSAGQTAVVLHPLTMDFDNNVYVMHGYANREAYLAELRADYGAMLVDALTSMLPASEDFDGLITELEDNTNDW